MKAGTAIKTTLGAFTAEDIEVRGLLRYALTRKGEERGVTMVGEPRFSPPEIRDDGFEWFTAVAEFA